MKRSTRWTTAIAATALLAVPVAARAQAPAPATTAPTQGAQTPAASDTQQAASSAEHLRQAEAALNDIPAASLTGAAETRVAELKRHINNLEKAAGPSSSSARGAAERGGNWGTEVAAMDRILSELLGPQGATGAPEPTGTSGVTAPPSTTRSKPATAITLDDAARAKLQEVRTHITAFAASMSSTPRTPGAEPAATASPSQPSPAETPAATAPPSPTASTSTPTPSTGAQSSTPTTQAPAPTSSPAQPAEPPAAAQNPQSSQPASPTTPSSPTASAAPTSTQQVDPDTVKRHLTAARNSLSELTQLPAATQLTGDTRAQVSQLITNFNELITTNADWKAAYAKVQANLSTLIGEQRTDESPTPAAGAAGAVGTSGTVTLDPAIRSKLVEFRTHLMEFEKAASGGAAPSGTPQASTTASEQPPASTPPAASSASSTASTASSSPAETSGRTAGTAGAVGTSGSTAASPKATDQPQASPSPNRPNASSSRPAEAGGHHEVLNHIEAIEAILNGGRAAGATGTSGKEGQAGSPSTLSRAQIEEIRSHLAELRKAMNQEK
jgi:hypothetical protein